jgi:hypothetical protein
MGKKPDLSLVEPSTEGSSPPRKLGGGGLALWNSIVNDYAIEDAGGRELLCQACEAQDRIAVLSERITAEGETIVNRRSGLVRVHPAIRDERQLRAFVVKTLEKLGVVYESIKPMGRPGSPVGWRP